MFRLPLAPYRFPSSFPTQRQRKGYISPISFFLGRTFSLAPSAPLVGMKRTGSCAHLTSLLMGTQQTPKSLIHILERKTGSIIFIILLSFHFCFIVFYLFIGFSYQIGGFLLGVLPRTYYINILYDSILILIYFNCGRWPKIPDRWFVVRTAARPRSAAAMSDGLTKALITIQDKNPSRLAVVFCEVPNAPPLLSTRRCVFLGL